MELFGKKPTREYLQTAIEGCKYEIDRLNKLVYYHMDLQAKGVKYKPRSKDVTYHGRKAIHALMAIDREVQRMQGFQQRMLLGQFE